MFSRRRRGRSGYIISYHIASSAPRRVKDKGAIGARSSLRRGGKRRGGEGRENGTHVGNEVPPKNDQPALRLGRLYRIVTREPARRQEEFVTPDLTEEVVRLVACGVAVGDTGEAGLDDVDVSVSNVVLDWRKR